MDDTLTLLRRAHDGDKAARELLVQENLGLVWSIVRRFRNRGVEQEDLFQIGSIGLLKAIDKFDLAYDVQFSTYAVPMITGEIKRFLRDDGMLKVSRTMKETAVRALRAREKLETEQGREPTITEIAAALEMSTEEVVLALEAGSQVESLHKTIYQGDGNDISLMDKLEEKTDRNEEVLNQILLEEILGTLKPEERRLIYLRYYREKTQTEIAAELGISGAGVPSGKENIKDAAGKVVKLSPYICAENRHNNHRIHFQEKDVRK